MLRVNKKFLDSLNSEFTRIDNCLYIRTRNNKQTYVFVYMISRKRRVISIGDVNMIPLNVAKNKAVEYRTMIENGIDPLEARKENQTKDEKKDYLFKEFLPMAIDKIAETKQWKNPKSRSQWENTFKTYVIPVIGNHLLTDITRDDIISVLEPIWKEKSETANRLRGRIESVFNLAIVMGLYKNPNPAIWRGNLSFFLAPTSKVKRVTHHDALKFSELRKLFLERFDAPITTVSTQAILFGALTATRVNEFVEMTWNEIDFRTKVWLIPPERRKDGKNYPHRVPLSEQAMAILRKRDRSKMYVFPGESGVGHISKETPRIFIKRYCGHGTMHGCRSTFSDWCAENGKDPILREKSLMHTTGNEVTLAYQRSDLLEQRRVLMQAWADALTK